MYMYSTSYRQPAHHEDHEDAGLGSRIAAAWPTSSVASAVRILLCAGYDKQGHDEFRSLVRIRRMSEARGRSW